ncbi:MAG TPA: polyprenyl synthetase family protein [Spirochaetia bacterium]|nr:polyprenyl synthetase family protein [Spirochaetia bacterium]
MLKKPQLIQADPLAALACDRLLEFTLSGKMIRGCLVSLGFSISRGSKAGVGGELVREAGAAMELFQSGLLIHDDIMDRDLTRRGRPTIFNQYSRDAARDGIPDWRHLGEALGICAGDLAFFLAYELIAGLALSPAALGRVLSLISRELAAVGIAQMRDVAWGSASSARPDEEQILRLYRYKTGRYTFSLPLMAGGILAEADLRTMNALESLGECLGIMFQIRDDEIGLFGDPRQTGKPVGSDIREGKKTLLFARLISACSPEDSRQLSDLFGNPHITEDDLDYVRGLVESSGVRESLRATLQALQDQAAAIIRDLPDCTGEDRDTLEGLLDFVATRSS